MIPKQSNLILQLCFDHSIQPFYRNVIKNKLSNQEFCLSYNPDKSQPLPNLFMVSDIPDYLDVELLKKEAARSLTRIPQYEGYLLNLKKFKNADELVNQTLSRNPRKNLRAKHRKLELNHEISYQFYHGEIEKKHYDYLFEKCYDLMEARFIQKKIYNRYLLNWKYYYNHFYSKILTKEASICVIYDKKKPVTITLNFHQADIVFSFIQIYDVDYYKYSMGDIAMYKNIEWCYQNQYNVWDVSKGATENKLRWSNHIYLFEYHIFYNNKSLLSKFLAFIYEKKLKAKQLLRNKGIIGGIFQLDRLYYYTKMKKLKNYNWKNP